jgi:hypothetical protein
VPVSTDVETDITVQSEPAVFENQRLSNVMPEQEMRDASESGAQSEEITGIVESHKTGNRSSTMKYILQGSTAQQVESDQSTFITITRMEKGRIINRSDILQDQEPLEHQIETTDGTRCRIIKEEEPEYEGESPDIHLPKEILEIIRPKAENIRSRKQTLEVGTAEENTSGSLPVSTKTALEQSMPRYSTRFMGQKRVVEVGSVDSSLCKVIYTDHEGYDVPVAKVIKLDKSRADRDYNHEEQDTDVDSVDIGGTKSSAVAVLPSLSEQTMNLTWNKSKSGESKPPSVIEIEPVVSKQSSVDPPRRRGRPRKDSIEQKQAATKVRVQKANKDDEASSVCTFCNKMFKNHTGLSIHMQWKHGMSDAVGQKKTGPLETYTCEYCSKVGEPHMLNEIVENCTATQNYMKMLKACEKW